MLPHQNTVVFKYIDVSLSLYRACEKESALINYWEILLHIEKNPNKTRRCQTSVGCSTNNLGVWGFSPRNILHSLLLFKLVSSISST